MACSHRRLDGEVRFHEATLPQSGHWHELQHVVQHRVLRYFRTHGLLDDDDAHGMLSWQGTGALLRSTRPSQLTTPGDLVNP